MPQTLNSICLRWHATATVQALFGDSHDTAAAPQAAGEHATMQNKMRSSHNAHAMTLAQEACIERPEQLRSSTALCHCRRLAISY